jgi:hypothetical protein
MQGAMVAVQSNPKYYRQGCKELENQNFQV